MLKGIDPILTGDLLKILDDMGHGDTVLLVDRNYPAAAAGRPVVRLGEVGVVRAARALLSVLPLDQFVGFPLERMEVDEIASKTTAVQDEVLEVARAVDGREVDYGVVPRLEFYQRAREAFAVVHTLESSPYACFILRKGVVLD